MNSVKNAGQMFAALFEKHTVGDIHTHIYTCMYMYIYTYACIIYLYVYTYTHI